MKGNQKTIICLLVISVMFNIASMIDVRSFSPGDMVVTKLRAGDGDKTLADVYMIKERPVPWFPVPWRWRASLIREGVVYA
ncbi:MAG: hypothetical protein EOP85_05775, partial [Verrucomicrobiaceae bacterium]